MWIEAGSRREVITSGKRRVRMEACAVGINRGLVFGTHGTRLRAGFERLFFSIIVGKLERIHGISKAFCHERLLMGVWGTARPAPIRRLDDEGWW